MHLAAMFPGNLERVNIVTQIGRIIFVRPAKGHGSQLLIIAHGHKAMYASVPLDLLALKKTGSGKADFAKFSFDPGLVKRKSRLRAAIGQPRQLHAKSCIRFWRARRIEHGILAGIVQVIFFSTISDWAVHIDLCKTSCDGRQVL